MTYRNREDHARETGPDLRESRGKVRKMLVALTSGPVWQMLGALVRGVARETLKAEVWQGIGFSSRPRSGVKPEGLVIYVGKGTSAPQVFALRDEGLRQISAADLTEDETAIYNSVAIVRVKPDKTIEARSIGGSAIALATVDDLLILKAQIATAPIALGANGAAAIATQCDTAEGVAHPDTGPHWPRGTQVFKAE